MGVTLAEPAERGETIESLGKLLLGLLVFWAYLDFMQLLIIWQSDLPHEADWYIRRTDWRMGGSSQRWSRACTSSCRSSHSFGRRCSDRVGRWVGWPPCW